MIRSLLIGTKILLQKIREKEKFDHYEKDDQLQKDDEPKIPTQRHSAKPIIIKVKCFSQKALHGFKGLLILV